MPTAKLRDAALAALAARTKAQADEDAAIAKARSDSALARVAKSPLKQWFPDVQWEFVGDLNDGTTLVREKGGLDTVIGVTPFYETSGPPEGREPVSHAVAIYKQQWAEASWDKAWTLVEAADLGAYLEATEPQEASEPERQP